MIKFFRKIRKSLLLENKNSRYFKYAIGEIILVVIGILIALQINNWNSNRILENNQLQLAKRLLAETQRNIDDFKNQKKLAYSSGSSVQKVLQLIDEDYTNVKESLLDSLLFNVLISPTYDFNSSVLNEALSTGQVANFKSDSLKNLIYSLPTSLADLNEREQRILKDSDQFLIPLIYEYASLRQVDYKFSGFGKKIGNSNLRKTDNRILLSLRKFENVMDNQFYLFTKLKEEYEKMDKKLVVLQKLLKKEINSYLPE